MSPHHNIILIGYRATGKTTVGKLLAASLNMTFIDMDHLLEERIGQSIRALVAEQGWEAFRKKERDLLVELSRRKGLVLATGGGAILHQDIWPEVKKSGLVAWLKLDKEVIAARLAQDPNTKEQRPSLTDQGTLQEISQVLETRTPLYSLAAHLSVDAGLPPKDIAENIHSAYLAFCKKCS